MKLTGAEIICESLLKEGADVIFGYPGGAIMPFYDALTKYPQLRHILVRHEQGAGHAAEGYARVSGKAGVCVATSGPGATNLITPIADAMMDSVPIVCITGQVAAHLIGSDAFQETDVVGITSVVCKHNCLVTRAQDIPAAIKEAFHISTTGRPGPVVVDIAKNAQVEAVEFVYPESVDLPGYKPTLEGNPIQINKAAELINAAKKPQILAGHGILIAHAEEALIALAEKADIPVTCTLHGLSCIPRSHPKFAGMLGMHGNYSANLCSQEADLLIAIGMRFDDRVTGKLSEYSKQAKIIHIDIDPAEQGKNIRADVPIVGDAKRILDRLLPLVNQATHPEWFAKFRELDAIETEKVINREVNHPTGQLKMGEVVKTISDLTDGNAVIVADVGQHQMIAARYYQFQKPDSFITSGGAGTMGFSLPAGMGAKVGRPDREVWVVVGDGSFQMTLQELITIAQDKIPVKIAILNNNFLGMVRQWQELFFDNRYSQVNLKNPDFVKLSEACGIPAAKVSKREEMKEAIEKARATDGPFLIEFVCETEENVFPMIPAGAAVKDIRLE